MSRSGRKKGSIPWNKGKDFPQMLGNKNAFLGDKAKKNTGNRRAQTMYQKIRKCERCKKRKERFQMIRHHIDGNTLNNIPSNIEFLCRSCHIEEHRGALLEARGLKKKQ